MCRIMMMASGRHSEERTETLKRVILETVPVDQIEITDSIELASENVWEDRLIERVKSYPLLWDRTRRDYGHQEKCTMIWSIIAKTLGRTPANCASQWKNLRDSYVRRLKCVRRLAFHGLTPRKPSWRHFDAMSFLDDHVSHRGQVDSNNDQPLPNCSSKNVAFFDDGLARAPNKNKLGGMGKKGPSHVRLTSLPKEPVALFSRIGLGEITVVDDTNDQNTSDHLVHGQDGDGSHVGIQDGGNETYFTGTGNSVEVITSDGSIVSQNHVLEPNVVHIVIEESNAKILAPDLETSEAVEAVQSAVRRENANTSDKVIERLDLVSSSMEMKSPDVLRHGRKRTSQVLEGNDDVKSADAISIVQSQSIKSTINISHPDFHELKEDIRYGFASIGSNLESIFESQKDENFQFALSVAQTLARLPDRVRAEARVKIHTILHEAEIKLEVPNSVKSVTDISPSETDD